MGGIGSGRTRTPPYIRFWDKVKHQENGCWEWTGGTRQGVPVFWDGDGPVRSRRWAFEYAKGKIPAGGRVYLTCGNKKCVRPGHMRLSLPKDRE